MKLFQTLLSIDIAALRHGGRAPRALARADGGAEGGGGGAGDRNGTLRATSRGSGGGGCHTEIGMYPH